MYISERKVADANGFQQVFLRRKCDIVIHGRSEDGDHAPVPLPSQASPTYSRSEA